MLFDPLRRIQHSTDIRFIISVKMDTQELLEQATKRKRQGRCNKCPAFFGMKKSIKTEKKDQNAGKKAVRQTETSFMRRSEVSEEY